MGRPCSKTDLAKYEQAIKAISNNRKTDLAKNNKIIRLVEMIKAYREGNITGHQLQELMGVNVVSEVMTNLDFPEGETENETEQWKRADWLRSRLPKEQWSGVRI